MRKYLFYNGCSQEDRLEQLKTLYNKLESKNIAVIAPTFASFNRFCQARLDRYISGEDVSTEGDVYIYTYNIDEIRGYRFDDVIEHDVHLLPVEVYWEITEFLKTRLIKQ